MFGLVFAVPLSAGKNLILDNGYHSCILAYDIHNGALISGMKLSNKISFKQQTPLKFENKFHEFPLTFILIDNFLFTIYLFVIS